MLTEERQQYILQLLQQKNIVKLNELVKLLDTSESTIRRDLQELEDKGLLERIHGGAKKIRNLTFEPSMTEKSTKHAVEKKMIVEHAASLVAEGDVIYLDAGSTTLEMVAHLPVNQNIKVVTNSVKHAVALIDRQIQTIILGGNIKLSTHASLGFSSMQQLQTFRFDKAFMGMNGADLQSGFTTPDPEEAALKRVAIEHSEQAFVLIDHSKFGQTTFAFVAPLEAAVIVTNRIPDNLRAPFQEKTNLLEVTR
ncbi:DeoR/GlpR family DNA-binding transcription regulator [Vagococcus acidifermentans]|uniref:DeoR family transcriptional regulator n=1 Tax=Vagococcus acidifermentans TaxID=564710 RepID=A0A430ASY2_9ENTE|nr:DeoR/GlpR family DNA-binding transcription regulator [Vagococcus acidifermentans]RSU11168.1 DeoR family transcriptional regulator [Vagococcus acidifermentans]